MQCAISYIVKCRRYDGDIYSCGHFETEGYHNRIFIPGSSVEVVEKREKRRGKNRGGNHENPKWYDDESQE